VNANQTAIIDDNHIQDLRVGSQLIKQFTVSHPQGRNRRFLEALETSDPSSFETEGIQSQKVEDMGDVTAALVRSHAPSWPGCLSSKVEGVVLDINAADNTFLHVFMT